MRALIVESQAVCRRRNTGRCLVMAAVFMSGLGGTGSSAEEVDWIGGQGLWTDPTLWSPAVVPNDGTPPLSLYAVVIGAMGTPPNAAVTLPSQGSPFNVFSLNLQTGTSLSLQSGASLGIQGSVAGPLLSNAGTINLAAGSTLVVPATGTILGGGTINLAAGATLTGANFTALTIGNQTLIGAGSLSVANWTNSGTILTAPQQQFTLSGNLQNNGLLAAQDGGTLVIPSGTSVFSNSQGAGIQAGPGSTVIVNGSVGGNIKVIGNGIIQGSGGLTGAGSIVNSPTGVIHLTGQPLDFYGSLVNPAGGQITIPGISLQTGDSLFNAGSLQLQSLSGNQEASGTTLLRGGGQITLGTAARPATIHSVGEPLINVDEIIQGAGTWTAMFVNDGTIGANIPMASLTIGSPNAPTTPAIPNVNNGTMGASNGGHLVVNGRLTGAGGWTANGGTITFQGNSSQISTIGPITVTNGGRLEFAPTTGELTSATLTASNLTLDTSSSISNQGSIRLLGNFSYGMKDPSAWNWPVISTQSTPRLIMDGGTAATAGSTAGWATLELGQKDNGPTGPGYDVGFSIPALEIGSGAHVLLTDLLDNGNRGGPAGTPEALYVDQLSFDDPSAQINLDGLHLYYRQLTAGSASQIIDSASVPEPACLGLAGCVVAMMYRRRRARHLAR